MLCAEGDEAAWVDPASLEDFTAQELEALVPQPSSPDSDTGPYDAWYQAHKELPRPAFTLASEHDGLRERAYVLWDGARLREYGLLETFSHVFEFSTREHSEEERAAMEHSWDERSKIWQKGGSGFWYIGDESQIVWP